MVRVIDVFIERLDISGLGFKTQAKIVLNADDFADYHERGEVKARDRSSKCEEPRL